MRLVHVNAPDRVAPAQTATPQYVALLGPTVILIEQMATRKKTIPLLSTALSSLPLIYKFTDTTSIRLLLKTCYRISNNYMQHVPSADTFAVRPGCNIRTNHIFAKYTPCAVLSLFHRKLLSARIGHRLSSKGNAGRSIINLLPLQSLQGLRLVAAVPQQYQVLGPQILVVRVVNSGVLPQPCD